MCKLFNEWSPQIKRYCEKNAFDFGKAKALSKCWSKDDIILQYFDPNNDSVKKGLGLLDETPMPVVLWIRKKGDVLEFEQTEYTKKYLSL